MGFRRVAVVIAAVGLLGLSACAAEGAPAQSGAARGAAIQLAVSQTCVAGSSASCVSVDGESIVVPAAFDEAAVQNAEVIDADGRQTVQVTFTPDGAAVLGSVTTRAVQAGSASRLAMKAGDRIIGAPVVLSALTGQQVSIAVPAGADAQQLADDILGR